MASAWRATRFLVHGLNNYTKQAIEHRMRAKDWDSDALNVDATGLVAVVTGANSGLGLETSKFLAGRGATVHMVCRSEEKGKKAQEEIAGELPTGRGDGKADGSDARVELHLCDMGEMEQVRRLAAELPKNIDVLINNAGLMPPERKETSDGNELTFAVNTLGWYLLTNMLVPKLTGSEQYGPARVINISSGGCMTQKMHLNNVQFDKCKFDGTTAYAQTKREMLYLTHLFAERYPTVNFFSCHPGWADTPGVQTQMPSFYDKMKSRLRTVAQGADTMCWLAVSKAAADVPSGSFLEDRRVVPEHICTSWFASTESSDEEIQQLWDVCAERSGWTTHGPAE